MGGENCIISVPQAPFFPESWKQEVIRPYSRSMKQNSGSRKQEAGSRKQKAYGPVPIRGCTVFGATKLDRLIECHFLTNLGIQPAKIYRLTDDIG